MATEYKIGLDPEFQKFMKEHPFIFNGDKNIYEPKR